MALMLPSHIYSIMSFSFLGQNPPVKRQKHPIVTRHDHKTETVGSPRHSPLSTAGTTTIVTTITAAPSPSTHYQYSTAATVAQLPARFENKYENKGRPIHTPSNNKRKYHVLHPTAKARWPSSYQYPEVGWLFSTTYHPR
ncbi:hypothetical protein IF1G_05390 [Cordyceps javanica]|uniref:Uncharacterized protein n=1 Tax=Cordyceps javanica TaxID=43265 RepID=A0A545V1F7_9HYPO|nr:hypothetical protein IF1G_05390 [Cordyceps javanica]TQW07240.1 hypothetical protein IF2G_05624 [Cordyceps javanica]